MLNNLHTTIYSAAMYGALHCEDIEHWTTLMLPVQYKHFYLYRWFCWTAY